MDDAVPSHYEGVWRRTLLTAPGVRDDGTLVLWMQTAQWHADLRIPRDRPDCSGRRSLADCSRTQLLGLLRQEGFAGITTVDGAICEWHRRLDYRPTGRRDLGSMAFSPAFDAIDEEGVESDYVERWEREPNGEGRQGVAFVPDGPTARLWLFVGTCFMRLRERALHADAARIAWQRVQDGSAHDDELRRLADFEISFGTIVQDRGRIVHSTLPWLEGEQVELPAPADSARGEAEHVAAMIEKPAPPPAAYP